MQGLFNAQRCAEAHQEFYKLSRRNDDGESVRGFLGAEPVESRGGKKYILFIRDDFSTYIWVYFLRHKSEATESFERWLADMGADAVPLKEAIVWSDNGGEVFGGSLTRSVMRITSPVNILPQNAPSSMM